VTSTQTPALDDDPPRRLTFGLVAGLAIFLALVAFWIYAFFLAPDDKVDALEDRSFVDAANAICEARYAELDALPPAHASATPTDRVAVLDQSNEVVARLVAELREAAAPATGRDRELLDMWLADWDAYLQARLDYADDLRTGDEGALFLVPARHGGQITQTMDGFARTNRITECLVPLDV